MLPARENPFRVERVHRIRYRFPEGNDGWDPLLVRFEALGGRGAIVGSTGTGKTTLLEDLAERLRARGRAVRVVTVSAERRLPRAARGHFLAAIGPRDVLCVDGADALGPFEWLRILHAGRRAGGLVVTAHREGRLPTLYRTETSPALLAGIVADLDASVAVPGDLFERNCGNVRAALRELYDAAARSSGPR